MINCMLRGIKTIDIGKEVAGGIANPAIGLTGALENFIRYSHLGTKICTGNPQTQNISTQLIDYLLWRNHIADGLGHLTAILINGKSMGQYCLVRGGAIDSDGCLQG